ncbi:location of vulva defective 1-like isoform X2 [Homarus americanus]|uniref:location of vulva defective 1-like isoform X2 n=1 Tax=Homarus americanus TaxID=6706 RepID=UPI001C444F66|nr:location of vulva defective 1-like isoform X2 [Homarus americanus]
MEWRRLLCVFVALETTILSPGASYSSPTSPPQLSSPSTSPPQLSLPSTSPPQLSSALNTNTSLASSSSHSHKGDSASSLTTLPPVVNTGDLQLPSNDQVVERQWSLVPKIERVTSHKPPVTSLPLLRRKKSVCSYDVTVKSREVKEVHEITGEGKYMTLYFVPGRDFEYISITLSLTFSDPILWFYKEKLCVRELDRGYNVSIRADGGGYWGVDVKCNCPEKILLYTDSYYTFNYISGMKVQAKGTSRWRKHYSDDNCLTQPSTSSTTETNPTQPASSTTETNPTQPASSTTETNPTQPASSTTETNPTQPVSSTTEGNSTQMTTSNPPIVTRFVLLMLVVAVVVVIVVLVVVVCLVCYRKRSVADKSARSLEAPVGCDPLSSEVDDNIDLRELRGRQGSSYFSDNSLYGVITQPEDTPANLRSSYFSDNSLYGVIAQPEDTPANLRSSYFSNNSL